MEKDEFIKKIKETAEGYFERGEFFCSEAVVKTINDVLGKPFDDSVTKLASGFPIGIGKSGCVCGAISGGVMALGMAYSRNHGQAMNEKMLPMSADLHNYIKGEYKSTCCRVITKDFEFASPERKRHCVKITGKVAAYVAEKLIDDGEITL